MGKLIFWSIVLFLVILPFLGNILMLLGGEINGTVLFSTFFHLTGLIVSWFLFKKFFASKSKEIKNEIKNKKTEIPNKKLNMNKDPNQGAF